MRFDINTSEDTNNLISDIKITHFCFEFKEKIFRTQQRQVE